MYLTVVSAYFAQTYNVAGEMNSESWNWREWEGNSRSIILNTNPKLYVVELSKITENLRKISRIAEI